MAEDHAKARRTTMTVLLGVIVVLVIAPVFLLNSVLNPKNDAAYQALLTYAQAQNGNRAAEAKLAAHPDRFYVRDLSGGAQVLAARTAGACWSVEVGAGVPGTPMLTKNSVCSGRTALFGGQTAAR